MNRKNKHDSSNNFILMGKKRSNESETNEKTENALIKKNSIPSYESISGLYKNIFGISYSYFFREFNYKFKKKAF